MDIRQVEAFQAVMTYGTTALAAASKAIKVCNSGSGRRIRLLSSQPVQVLTIHRSEEVPVCFKGDVASHPCISFRWAKLK